MLGRFPSLFGIGFCTLMLPISVGANIPAPANGAMAPFVAPVSLAAVPPSAAGPVPAVQTQPDPAAWAARMVRPCVKAGSRMRC